MGSKSGFAASGFFSHETYVVFLLNTPSTSLLTPPLQVVTKHWHWVSCIHIKLPLAISITYGHVYVLKSRDITLPTKVHLVEAMVFPVVIMDVRAGLWRKLSTEELMLLKCGVGEEFWESLGLQGGPPVHPKDQSWVFIGRTDVEADTPILWPPDVKSWHLKSPWCWERLKARGEWDNRGWDGWMASPTQWTWVWVKSGSWWWIGRPDMVGSMGLPRVGHDWATELILQMGKDSQS